MSWFPPFVDLKKTLYKEKPCLPNNEYMLWFPPFVDLKKTLYKETKILQDIVNLQLISSFNTSQNYHHSKIHM
jgi:hypothetical protein